MSIFIAFQMLIKIRKTFTNARIHIVQLSPLPPRSMLSHLESRGSLMSNDPKLA